MAEETRLEVIKAIAYGESIEDIANMAEVEVTEIEELVNGCADEIGMRRKEIMEAAGL